MATTNSPISTTRLRQISNDACDSALSTATAYEHSATQRWNNEIINAILKSLISESTSGESSGGQTKYKFCVNSTIIQHLSDPRPAGSSSSTAGTQTDAPAAERTGELVEAGGEGEEGVSMGADEHKKVGRRGMHSASGAYWNNEKDGMWSHKYEGGEGKGMDIVISVMWIAV
ncbi:hypothetical protein LTR85_010021 [Meristemomyces frigidus]|nr:hypothetical protein LTR85_010021 [Meristemomyces frigidus]